MKTVHELWEGYAAMTLDPQTGPTQYQEMRRAFYAGFVGGFYGLDRAEAMEDDEYKVSVWSLAIDKELREFNKLVQKGER